MTDKDFSRHDNIVQHLQVHKDYFFWFAVVLVVVGFVLTTCMIRTSVCCIFVIFLSKAKRDVRGTKNKNTDIAMRVSSVSVISSHIFF